MLWDSVPALAAGKNDGRHKRETVIDVKESSHGRIAEGLLLRWCLCLPAPKGWSQMAIGVPADPSLGPTPGEAMRSSSSVAKQEDDDMQAAIQVRLTCNLLRVPCIFVNAIAGLPWGF